MPSASHIPYDHWQIHHNTFDPLEERLTERALFEDHYASSISHLMRSTLPPTDSLSNAGRTSRCSRMIPALWRPRSCVDQACPQGWVHPLSNHIFLNSSAMLDTRVQESCRLTKCGMLTMPDGVRVKSGSSSGVGRPSLRYGRASLRLEMISLKR